MNEAEIRAETAWAIELARSAALQALVKEGDVGLIKLAWMQGFYSGAVCGLEQAREVIRA